MMTLKAQFLPEEKCEVKLVFPVSSDVLFFQTAGMSCHDQHILREQIIRPNEKIRNHLINPKNKQA